MNYIISGEYSIHFIWEISFESFFVCKFRIHCTNYIGLIKAFIGTKIKNGEYCLFDFVVHYSNILVIYCGNIRICVVYPAVHIPTMSADSLGKFISNQLTIEEENKYLTLSNFFQSPCNFLLKCIQFPHYCAAGMMAGKPIF